MEENAKQITLHAVFSGRPQKLAGISATQGSEKASAPFLARKHSQVPCSCLQQ